MFGPLKLLLPALMPSWRFFKTVDPSPRVQWILRPPHSQTPPDDWQAFRPRPQQLSFVQMMARMLWNARWNEGLFLVSCAERLTIAPTDHSRDEILRRIARTLPPDLPPRTTLQFRLLFIDRDQDGTLYQEITYESAPTPLAEIPQ